MEVEKIKILVEYLKQHKDNLKFLYKWNKGFDKDCKLIEEKGKLLHKPESISATADDIIKDWGGIPRGFDDIVAKYFDGFLESKSLPFHRISSTSKLACFYDPSQFIIYDSRVAYTINWLILSLNLNSKYFPIPDGKNSKMNAFDIEVLIRIKNKDKYNRTDSRTFISDCDASLFVTDDKAYFEMNNLINQIHYELYKNENKPPFYTQFLLFAIADNIVFDEIIKKVKIDF